LDVFFRWQTIATGNNRHITSPAARLWLVNTARTIASLRFDGTFAMLSPGLVAAPNSTQQNLPVGFT